mmetsp:Transcript_44241/g.116265  ORF Transcript_44241/g.116265 Transcript_44241/m.116265 type:complete len:250 (+) Transcript_44241:258-1007(+)
MKSDALTLLLPKRENARGLSIVQPWPSLPSKRILARACLPIRHGEPRTRPQPLGTNGAGLELIGDAEAQRGLPALNTHHPRLPPAIILQYLQYLAHDWYPLFVRLLRHKPQPRTLDSLRLRLAIVIDESGELDGILAAFFDNRGHCRSRPRILEPLVDVLHLNLAPDLDVIISVRLLLLSCLKLVDQVVIHDIVLWLPRLCVIRPLNVIHKSALGARFHRKDPFNLDNICILLSVLLYERIELATTACE